MNKTNNLRLVNEPYPHLRDDDGWLLDNRYGKIVDELGDCFWYLFAFCRELGIDPRSVVAQNTGKLEGRLANDTIRGDRRES